MAKMSFALIFWAKIQGKSKNSWNIGNFEIIKTGPFEKVKYFIKNWYWPGRNASKRSQLDQFSNFWSCFVILDPPQSRICHFLFPETILVVIYWEFWVFYRFSIINVRTRISNFGSFLNLNDYFNFGAVYWLLGYIFSHFGLLQDFWILRS